MAKVLLAGSEYTDNLLVLWVDDEQLKKLLNGNSYRTSGLDDSFDPVEEGDIEGSGIWLWEGEYNSSEEMWEGSARLANSYEFDLAQSQQSPL